MARGDGFLMPSKSKPQQRLMRAAAHTKGGYGGVPQKVGKEFVAADKRKAAAKGEASKADKAADKRGAKKAGVSQKKWEGSAADRKQDMRMGFRAGGSARS